MSSRQDSLVKSTAWQERDLEIKMTVTSGRKCFVSSTKSGPLGSLVKTLLESSRWYSPARRLRWEVTRTFAGRVTRCTRPDKSTLSSRSSETSRQSDIPSSQLLYRLVPSERPTEETGYGLLPTVQTQGLKICNKNGKTEFFPVELLPTPMAQDYRRRGAEQRAAGITGNGLQRDVANSQRVRSNEVLENLQPEQPDGKGITLVSSERFAANTESTGIKGERDKGQGKIQFNRRDLQSVRPSWQNFPTTEPAIRRGDDGISARLSGITFSRWRQESIKALGNSMVPQVVLEIFKAIESVESSVR